MTHCDFSVRSARDETRHIVGSSRITWIGCASCMKRKWRAVATSEVNSRMQCVAKIMAMPGTRTIVADLCMFRLARRTRICQRKCTDGHRRETSWNADAK